MENLLTPKEVAEGIENLVPIPINTQNVARSKRKLQYLKIGNKVYYTREWIEDFIKASIVKVEPKG